MQNAKSILWGAHGEKMAQLMLKDAVNKAKHDAAAFYSGSAPTPPILPTTPTSEKNTEKKKPANKKNWKQNARAMKNE